MIDFNLVNKILARLYVIDSMLEQNENFEKSSDTDKNGIRDYIEKIKLVVFSGRGEEALPNYMMDVLVNAFMPEISYSNFSLEEKDLILKDIVAYCLNDIENLNGVTKGENYLFSKIAFELQLLNGVLYESTEFSGNALVNAGQMQEDAWQRLVNAKFIEEEHPRDEKGRFIDKQVNIFIEDIRKREHAITKDVTEMAKLQGVENIGLDFRRKTKHSTSDKARRDSQEKKTTQARAVAEMSDLIRYTQGGTPDNLVEKGFATLKGLKEKGYTVRKVKNFWFDPENPYNGINVQMESPNKDRFEIQFNTPHNIEVKERMHKEYEKLRTNDSDEEKERIKKLMHEKYDKEWEEIENIKNFIYENLY